MAGQRGLKGFYVGLVVVAVAGATAIWWARQSAANANMPLEVGPLPVTGESFPGYSMGSDSAPVEIIEYADFQCPACALFAVLTVPDVKQRLVATGQVRWTFRDFPLDIHRNAVPAHLAAACADEQGKFWDMHDLLFFRAADWIRERRPKRRFRGFAKELGLDMRRYGECMSSRRHLGRFAASRQQGLALGVKSTPSLLIGNLLVVGGITYDSVKALVDRAAAASR
ncbi:MAG: thioredoxin domain-containing protein [Gemmatimonadetes bacterium]|nr:thioredoxin domain-containing protein [Gemmatimonadota bacterium]